MVEETLGPGASVAVIARRRGVNANQVFHWRKLEIGVDSLLGLEPYCDLEVVWRPRGKW